MTDRFAYTVTLLVLVILGSVSVRAQFPISIPNIPKIKKPKTTTENTSNQTNTGNNNGNNNSQKTDTKRSAGCDQYSFVIGVFVDDIKKKQQEAAAYTGPQDKIYYVSATQDDYIRLAVSRAARDKWFADKKMNDYRADTACNKVDPALDDLSATVARTIPLYVPGAGKYANHNASEEALMKGKVSDIADLKVFKIGLDSASWNIEKNDLGIPINRYKYGLIYAKPSKADDPYCRMIFVNVIQDYAGGGTYGATYARFIKSEIAGCQAGN